MCVCLCHLPDDIKNAWKEFLRDVSGALLTAQEEENKLKMQGGWTGLWVMTVFLLKEDTWGHDSVDEAH